jgi:hypothetical protein
MESGNQPLLTRSRWPDRHDKSEQATQRRDQTAPRVGQTATRDGQTAPSQNHSLRMVKPRNSEIDEWKVNEGEKQEAHIEAHVRLPPKQVHQGRSEWSGYEVAKIPGEARTSRAAETNKTRG